MEYLEFKNDLGITRLEKSCEALVIPDFFPYVIQEMEDKELFVFSYDEINYKNNVFFVKENGEYYSPSWFQRSEFRSISYLKKIGQNKFIGLDRINHRIMIIEQGQVIWDFEDTCIVPSTIDYTEKDGLILFDIVSNKIIHIDIANGIKREIKINKNNQEFDLIEPICIQLCLDGNILITDRELQMIYEIDCEGKVFWEYGKIKNPGRKLNQLTYPQSAIKLKNGNVLITDSMNSRVLEVNNQGKVIFSYFNEQEKFNENNNLFYPFWSDETTDQLIMIADNRNNRILKVNRESLITWNFGSSNISKRMFSFPRSIEIIDNCILVADTSNNRILDLTTKGEVTWSFSKGKINQENVSLFWPRSAKRMSNGDVVIADGRNSRLIIVNKVTGVKRILPGYIQDNRFENYDDPHHIEILTNDNILVVDSSKNNIIKINQFGDTIRIVDYVEGLENSHLNDPHWASEDANGNLIIADSANHRIISLDKNDKLNWCIEEFSIEGITNKLYWPRSCQILNSSDVLIVDGGTGTILIVNKFGELIKSYTSNELDVITALKETRSIVYSNNEDEFYVSDTEGCRIINLNIVQSL